MSTKDEELYEADSYTLTRLPCDSFSILWTVEEFSRFLSGDYPLIESSEFQPTGPGTAKFALILEKHTEKISIGLKVIEKMEIKEISFKARVMLLDRFAECHKKSEEFSLQINEESEEDHILTSYSIDWTEDAQDAYLSGNEAATIRCEMRIFADPLNYPVTSKTSGYMHYSQLIDDLHRIYENNEFSDGVIEVEGQEFFISRAVLAARSPVFRTMFTCGLSESQNGRLKIEDFPAPVIRRLLDYVYTGRMGNIEQIAEDLLSAGHKYCIEGVQTLAQEELIKAIDEDSVCRLLIHADLYDAPMLKQQCVAFIAQHREQVMKTEGWTQLKDPQYHRLVVDLIETTKDLKL